MGRLLAISLLVLGTLGCGRVGFELGRGAGDDQPRVDGGDGANDAGRLMSDGDASMSDDAGTAEDGGANDGSIVIPTDWGTDATCDPPCDRATEQCLACMGPEGPTPPTCRPLGFTC